MSWQTLITRQPRPAESQHATSRLIPLTATALLRVSGEDAAQFLQNMLTNDVGALSVGQAQLTGLCTPKGRLLAVFVLLRREHDYLLALPTDIADAIRARLSLFVLRSKVKIDATAGQLAALGLCGVDSDVAPWKSRNEAERVHVRLPGLPGRELCIGPETVLATHAETLLAQGWSLAAESQWQCADIEAGLPNVVAATQEQFTPQQLNLDLIGGVSFKKGCYPGQEVVARLHYLGSPSRRMFLADLQAESPPQPGTVVRDEAGETLGHVVQAQSCVDGRIMMQLSMKLAGLDSPAYIDGHAVGRLAALAVEPDARQG